MSGLKVTVPVPLGPAQLVATDVPDGDGLGLYDAGTTYALAARCYKNGSVYESAQASNTGHDPEADTGGVWWLRVSATNRYRAFDLLKSNITAQASSFYYEFDPGKIITAVHCIDVQGASSARVRLTDPIAGVVYDSGDSSIGWVMEETSYWCYYFGPRNVVNELHLEGLPAYESARLRIDFSGGADLSVRYILAGQQITYGEGVSLGARLGEEAWTGTGRDAWGTPTLKKRPKSRRQNFVVFHKKSQTDEFIRFLRGADTIVALWNMADAWSETKVLGNLSSWETLFNYNVQQETTLEVIGIPQSD